ncbi:MAG TPA: hypothetical protein VFQ40_04950 [Actinomycetota bacterium]|nr:hypothetical protein [Actinomycetota bacterium]
MTAPLLLAASDPAGDVTGCRGGPGPGGAPDLVDARGQIVELGTSARWTLTFAGSLPVPDAEGRPFRVDVAIRDPDVPVVSFASYRGINRIVRMDATIDHPTQILLIPERGASEFTPPRVDGATLTFQVPGRTLSDDEDLTGTSPGLERLRWSVIVRDERACDVLGDGRPTERLVPVQDASAPGEPTRPPTSPWPWAVGAAAAIAAAAASYLLRRRASS